MGPDYFNGAGLEKQGEIAEYRPPGSSNFSNFYVLGAITGPTLFGTSWATIQSFHNLTTIFRGPRAPMRPVYTVMVPVRVSWLAEFSMAKPRGGKEARRHTT